MKHDLRLFFLSRRRKLSEKQVKARSAGILCGLFSLSAFEKARVVACYADFKKEPQTRGIIRRLLREGKTVALPRMLPKIKSLVFCRINSLDELVLNPKGILEPQKRAVRINPPKIGAILVPGIAFDQNGFRLGFGHGYFDRCLKRFPRAIKIGLAFEEFVVPFLPRESHDVSMDFLVTEKKVRRFS